MHGAFSVCYSSTHSTILSVFACDSDQYAQQAKVWVPLDERLCRRKAYHMAAAAHQQAALALRELKHLLLCLAAPSGLRRAMTSNLVLRLKHEKKLSCLPRVVKLWVPTYADSTAHVQLLSKLSRLSVYFTTLPTPCRCAQTTPQHDVSM